MQAASPTPAPQQQASSPVSAEQASLDGTIAEAPLPSSTEVSTATHAQAAPPVPSVSPSSPSMPTTSRQATDEDLYDYRKCTIFIVVQLRPEAQAGQARQVLLSVQNGVSNKEDLPLYRLLSEEELGGPFPPALATLLEELQQQLPQRKQRHEAQQEEKRRQEAERATKAHSTKAAQRTAQSATGTKATVKQQQSVSKTPATSPVPSVATTNSPIPKQALQQGGLFDDL